MGPLTTPKKGRDVGSVDPWTPTSNLKMLISAASPDIRNREKELCMDKAGQEALESIQARKTLTLTHDRLFRVFKVIYVIYFSFIFSQEIEIGEDSEKMVSRKEKSLGLLCHKFLARYPDYPNAAHSDICLDDVATELSVYSFPFHKALICLHPQVYTTCLFSNINKTSQSCS